MTNPTPDLPPLIGLTGAAGSGKTTAMNWVLKNHNTNRMSFAGPLKVMTRELIRTALPKGWDHDAGAYIEDPVLKETPIPFLGNLTARRLMQTLGTEWGRQTLHPDFWVGIAAAKVERQLGSTFKKSDRVPIKVIFDDVRFENEAMMIRAYGGVIVRVIRPEHDKPPEIASHLSESMSFAADIDIVNDGSVEDLHAKMASLFPASPKKA